jgi:hypothetical protein
MWWLSSRFGLGSSEQAKPDSRSTLLPQQLAYSCLPSINSNHISLQIDGQTTTSLNSIRYLSAGWHHHQRIPATQTHKEKEALTPAYARHPISASSGAGRWLDGLNLPQQPLALQEEDATTNLRHSYSFPARELIVHMAQPSFRHWRRTEFPAIASGRRKYIVASGCLKKNAAHVQGASYSSLHVSFVDHIRSALKFSLAE